MTFNCPPTVCRNQTFINTDIVCLISCHWPFCPKVAIPGHALFPSSLPLSCHMQFTPEWPSPCYWLGELFYSASNSKVPFSIDPSWEPSSHPLQINSTTWVVYLLVPGTRSESRMSRTCPPEQISYYLTPRMQWWRWQHRCWENSGGLRIGWCQKKLLKAIDAKPKCQRHTGLSQKEDRGWEVIRQSRQHINERILKRALSSHVSPTRITILPYSLMDE